MKKKLKVIFGVTSGLSFLGLVIVSWVAFLDDRMESTALNTLMLIFTGCFIGCLFVYAILELSGRDSDEGGGTPSDWPGIPW